MRRLHPTPMLVGIFHRVIKRVCCLKDWLKLCHTDIMIRSSRIVDAGVRTLSGETAFE